MATLQIYEKLLQFPLFQGMSRDDLEIVAGHTRFGFLKVASGRPIVKVGDTCSQLYFLINGSVRVKTFSDDYGYSVEEQMRDNTPDYLEPGDYYERVDSGNELIFINKLRGTTSFSGTKTWIDPGETHNDNSDPDQLKLLLYWESEKVNKFRRILFIEIA